LSQFYKLTKDESTGQESLTTSTSTAFKLKYALGNRSYGLAYYRQEERIAYQNDVHTIKIVPILHRNKMTFFGMRPREEYVCFRRVKDAFMALDYRQNLTTWNTTTGKMIKQIKL
jgi:hypothetical protein